MEILTRGVAQLIDEKDLLKKLEKGTPLRAKLGVDPTSPDLHFGHSVVLEKLRQFQELGHQAVLIIGDFTAQIGDPTGRTKARPPLSREDILANAKTYTDQAFQILDKEKTEIVFNGDWFNKMTFADVIQLNAKVTIQQMLQREDFRNRMDSGTEVRLHEIQYPIVQGWDSVVVKADVELGGTDQLFNILVGRDLQKSDDQEPQVVMCMPLLEGLDGSQKMSKSLGNYIGITEAPGDMFGKVMSISDELMERYSSLLLGASIDPDKHPLESKKELAATIVTRFHSEQDAAAALENWNKRDTDEAEWPEYSIGERKDIIGVVLDAYQSIFEVKKSSTQVRQLIQQGSIRIDGEKITDVKATPEWASGQILKLDKKHSVRIK